MQNNSPRNFKQELAAIEKTFENQGGLSCASAAGNSGSTAAHATPSTTAGARAVCNSNTLPHYNVDTALAKALRVVEAIEQLTYLYPPDRALAQRAQYLIKQAKKQNGYDSNTRLELFPP